METILKTGNKFEWRGKSLTFSHTEDPDGLDDTMIHVHFKDHAPVCFVGGDTEVNGVLCQKDVDIIFELNK